MLENNRSGQSLGATAFWTAAVRALENERVDRLFSDPWARALTGEVGEAWIAGRTPESAMPIIIRTRYFDGFLLRIAGSEKMRQVVLLAAGLDTRAYRLGWPEGIRFFELDQAEVLAYKAQVLGMAGAKPAGERQAIGIDLSGDWQAALLERGFDPSQPAIWLLEGFLFYLSNADLVKILDTVCQMADPGSWLGFDCINSLVLRSPYTRKWVEIQAAHGTPWIGALDGSLAFLAERGWQADLTQAGDPEANHGRWTLPVLPVRMPDLPHNWYVTARKHQVAGSHGS